MCIANPSCFKWLLHCILRAASQAACTAGKSKAMMAVVKAEYKGSEEGVAPVMKMMNQGKATLSGLRPGPWEISVSQMGPGDKEQKKTVEVRAGETARLNLDW